ncbi:hypothetical protein [Rugamonas aquatica]|uniref:O-antigen ligase domain-containing protein n=1 Tax=Rugamonas aquatica TaxID=2743357 RepID=A0A6A7MVL6_9BURK|nr:hypothetical protein [Rugamonas aquatica]MQA36985.1 hypothetical protein [Rugamonas aquatica]
MRRSLWYSRLLSLVFFGAAIAILSAYPLHGSWLPAIVIGYGALLWRRPALWLLVLPALLPVVDLAPHTGWFFVEEIDVLLCLTAGFCYWHLDRSVVLPHFPPLFRLGLWGMAIACCIGLWRGVQPLPAIDANSFNNYLSPYNALRVGKAWFWGFVLLPPLKQAAGPALDGVRRLFFPGMLLGLLGVLAAAIYERWQFPGLLNFASDYRITAPFSAMHTGGAALDGYFAISVPLLAAWLFGTPSIARQAVAMTLLPLSLYAGLATFSRGLYLAYIVALVMLAGFPLAAWSRTGRLWRHRWAAVAVLAAVVLLTCVLDLVFASSGYRGYAAALGLLAMTLALSAHPLPAPLLLSSLICGLGLAGMLAWMLPVGTPAVAVLKAPYLMFLCSGLLFALSLRPSRMLLPPAVLALTGLMVSTIWIAYHHAGASTLAPSGGLVLLAMSPITFNVLRRRPLWRPNRRNVTALLAGAAVLAAAIPTYHGYFVAERFSTTASDLSARLMHWSRTLALMDDGPDTALLGAGLGKFPSYYFWRNQQHEVPPTCRYLDQAGNRYLRLTGGEYTAGYGEMLRMLHIVPVQPETAYVLALDARNSGPPAFLHVNLCERQLLYPQGCIALPLRQILRAPNWQRLQFPLSSGPLGASGRPVQLEISMEGEHAALDIDNVSLRSPPGQQELVRNGEFSDANDYWFFSSDHHHLPWHVKNLGLNLYFEMGWPGLLAYAGLLCSAGAELLRRAQDAAERAEATALLAALAAFQTVGLFDSLFDVPRITLLFMLLLCAATLRPAYPTSFTARTSCQNHA